MGENRDVERLTAFTDGVIAIAITLLVLDIRLPRPAQGLDDAALVADLLAIWPQYFGYALSFLVIGNFWISHSLRLRRLKSVDPTLLWLNMLFLLAIGFVPFITSVLSENSGRAATILYAATMIIASLLLTLVWCHALRREHATLTPAERRRAVLRSVWVPAVFALSILVAWFWPDNARYVWLLLIPVSFLNRRRSAAAS